MDKNNLLSKFHIYYNRYQNLHSAGPDLFFNEPCIGYVKKGYARFLYQGKTLYANEGDLVYIAFQTRYQSIWYGSPDIEWYTVNFNFVSKFAFYDYRFQIISKYPEELFEKMYNSYDSAPMLSVSYLYQLLDDIYSKMTLTTTVKTHSSIEKAMTHIENNYSVPISISTLENICHISRSSLFKQFKSALGVTPIEYKHNIMIQHAIDLLTNTNMSIEEISAAVGFSSSNYFRKVFVGITDKIPKELRKRSNTNTDKSSKT